MNAVISLEQIRVIRSSEEKISRKEELRQFFRQHVLDYAELDQDNSGIEEFEKAFIEEDGATKRS